MSRDELIGLLRALTAGHGAAGTESELHDSLHDMQMYLTTMEMQSSELQETRRSLEETRNSYTDLYDFTPIGYVTFDVRGVIREINITGAQMLGRERSLLINTPFISHLVKSDRKKFLGHLARCKQSDAKITSTISVSMERGNFFHLQLQSTTVRDSQQEITRFRTALIDISEVTEIRSQVEKLTQTEERVRLSIAVELQEQILESISMAEILLDKFASFVQSPENLATINKIKEYIDISIVRIEALTRQICPMPKYETGLKSTLRALAEMTQDEQKIPVEFQCDVMSFPVAGEISSTIIPVVREILRNSVKHSQAGKITISMSVKKGNILVKVEDNGIGFDDARIAGARENDGGFGLLKARRRMEHIGGVVQIDTAPGKGTSITLIAPLKAPKRGKGAQEFAKGSEEVSGSNA
jgi:two-component system nitrate/nitrite sensor histidine kinase NarX/two-component system sensor histidine kinase UhpB